MYQLMGGMSFAEAAERPHRDVTTNSMSLNAPTIDKVTIRRVLRPIKQGRSAIVMLLQGVVDKGALH